MDAFTIVVLDGALGASVAITLDILRTANRIAEVHGKPTIAWKVIGSSASVRMNNGMYIGAVPLAEAGPLGKSILVIPGLGLDGPYHVDVYGCRWNQTTQLVSATKHLSERLEREDIEILGELAYNHHAVGNVVAASCSSVFALGHSGLLDGRSVTTHWCLYDLLRQRHPECDLDTNRMLVQDGSLVTAGAAMSQMDLMLYLLRGLVGHHTVEQIRRYLLIDDRPTQSHYMTLNDLQMDDREVVRLEVLIEKHMPNIPTLKKIEEELFVTKKTLTRRIQKATGLTPLAFIQRIRLRHAQSLLETTGLSIDEIARRVGYSDSTALRRLVTKSMGCTPSQLRRSVKI
jgi:transcriptional regulator GlxA family with amidase domain